MQLAESEATLGGLVVNEMRLLYGARFAQQWQGLTPRALKESWDQKLVGLTEREVRAALVACLSRDWPPTVPEFLRMCRPWLSPEVAYREAVNGMSARSRGEMGEWSHPSIFWAAVKIGMHDLLNSTQGAMKSQWEKAFNDQLAKGAWEPITAPAVALPAPAGATEEGRKEAARAMDRIGAGDVLDQSGKDHRRWIAKVLAKGSKASHYAQQLAKKAAEEVGMVKGAA